MQTSTRNLLLAQVCSSSAAKLPASHAAATLSFEMECLPKSGVGFVPSTCGIDMSMPNYNRTPVVFSPILLPGKLNSICSVAATVVTATECQCNGALELAWKHNLPLLYYTLGVAAWLKHEF